MVTALLTKIMRNKFILWVILFGVVLDLLISAVLIFLRIQQNNTISTVKKNAETQVQACKNFNTFLKKDHDFWIFVVSLLTVSENAPGSVGLKQFDRAIINRANSTFAPIPCPDNSRQPKSSIP